MNLDSKNLVPKGPEFDFQKLKDFCTNLNNIIELNLRKFDSQKLGQLKDFGININDTNIIELNRIEFDFQKLGQLRDFGININDTNIIELNRIKFDFQKLGQLRDFGININDTNIIELNRRKFDFQKLGQLRDFGININDTNIIELNADQIEFDFQKLGQLKDLGININDTNIIELDYIEAKNLQQIKEIFDKYGFVFTSDINEWNNINLTEENKIELRKVHQIFLEKGMTISSIDELGIILDIISNSFSNKQNYIERKNNFLQKYRTLSDKNFDTLFKDPFDKGKYGIGNIYQADLGYCYAYTGFELLKKSNFFDVLIKSSMKETSEGREVKIPLGNPNGHIVKVNKQEIDNTYSFIDRETGELRSNVNINSNSSLGFKILEIVFIKEYLINNPKYLQKDEMIKKAKSEYEERGDIKITGELLNLLEGGWTSDFMRYILGNTVNTYDTRNRKKITTILEYINNGNIKIMLSHRIRGGTTVKTIDVKLKNGIKGKISTNHAYSVERTYIDPNSKETIVVIKNPHDTSKKIEISLNECTKIFKRAEITTIDINKLFNESKNEYGRSKS